MSNRFVTIKELARLTLPKLMDNLVFPSLCYRDLEKDAQDHRLGDTIQIRKPVQLTAVDFDPSTGVTQEDIQEESVDFVLNRIATVDVGIEALEGATSVDSLERIFVEPAAQALAEKINREGLELYKDIPYYVGTAGTTPSTLAAMAAVRKKMNQQKAPVYGRVAVWDPEADAAFTTLDAIVHAEKSGSTQALREGSIGRVMGFDHYMSQGVCTHATGITAATAVKVKDAVTSGAQKLNLTGTSLTGSLKKGDLMVISNKTYTVTADSAAAATNVISDVQVYPALPALNANTDVTLIAGHTANLAFCPLAFAFATRPLAAPAGVESYTTTYNGISLRVVRGYDMQHKREILSMDVLYGFKTLYPELAVRVLG